MSNDLFDNDLFEGQEFVRQDKRPRFVDKYAKHRFLPFLKIPVENAIILCILFLVLVVISYAVGIERGKRMARGKKDTVRLTQQGGDLPVSDEDIMRSQEEIIEFSGEKDVKGIKDSSADIYDEIPVNTYDKTANEITEQGDILDTLKEVEASGEDDNIILEKPEEKAYIIQLITFSSEGQAVDEVERLRTAGSDAVLSRSGRWYQVYVKGFSDIDEAARAQDKYISEYPDCYIRRLR